MPFHPSRCRVPGCGVGTVVAVLGGCGVSSDHTAEPREGFWRGRAADPGLVLLPGNLLLVTGGGESWSAWSSALLLLSYGCLTAISDTEMKLGSYWASPCS